MVLLPSIEAVTDADRAFVRALLVNSGGRLGRLGCPSGDQGDAEERQAIITGALIRQTFLACTLLYTSVFYYYSAIFYRAISTVALNPHDMASPHIPASDMPECRSS